MHQPEIPGNTGAIGRTCVGLEAKLWLVRPLGFRLDEKTLRRAGLDYWPNLVWEAVDHWLMLVEKLADKRFWYFTKKATVCLWDTSFELDDVLVFGCETAGLPDEILGLDPGRNLSIPMGDGIRSLNLSSAAAVAGYECARQVRVVGKK